MAELQQPPRGFLDLGQMLSGPCSIGLDRDLERNFAKRRRDDREAPPEPVLRALLGDYYRDRITIGLCLQQGATRSQLDTVM